jgi:hypothetical protein
LNKDTTNLSSAVLSESRLGGVLIIYSPWRQIDHHARSVVGRGPYHHAQGAGWGVGGCHDLLLFVIANLSSRICSCSLRTPGQDNWVKVCTGWSVRNKCATFHLIMRLHFPIRIQTAGKKSLPTLKSCGMS